MFGSVTPKMSTPTTADGWTLPRARSHVLDAAPWTGRFVAASDSDRNSCVVTSAAVARSADPGSRDEPGAETPTRCAEPNELVV
jgi:hypothetical protein